MKEHGVVHDEVRKPGHHGIGKRRHVSRNLEQWLTTLAVVLITLIAFESLAVTTAMPYIVDDLNGRHLYSLASGIALTTQLVTTALAGPWSDTRGPKRPLCIGILLFCLGLVIASCAPNIDIVVLGRAVQGLGGGLIVVPLYVLVGAHVTPAHQPRVFAAFAAAWVIPSLIGPAVAGFLVEYVHWRAVFAMVPILIAPLVPLLISKLRLFPDSHSPSEKFRPTKTFWYALIVGLAVGLLQILSGSQGQAKNASFIAGIVVASLIAFSCVRPLLPPGTLIAKRGVPSAILLRGILNGAFIAAEIFLVLMLKDIHGWEATGAGLVMAAGSITWAIGSWFQGRIVSESGRRTVPVIGTIIQLLGTAITLLGVSESMSGLWIIFGWVVAGFGTGLVYPAMTVLALAQTPRERHGDISSAIQIADTMGAAVFVAYGGIAFALSQGFGPHAFTVTIGLMVVLLAGGIWVASRVWGATPQRTDASASPRDIVVSEVTESDLTNGSYTD